MTAGTGPSDAPFTCGIHDPPCPDAKTHRTAQRAAWKKAASTRAKGLRNRRGTRPRPGYKPGMNITRPRGDR